MEFERKLDYQIAAPDERDYVFSLSKEDVVKLGASAGPSFLKLLVIRVEDQGNHGTCSAYALTTNFENVVFVVTGDKTFQASPMFNYTQSRILDSVLLTEDPGTTLRSACGNLRLAGACKDSSWPYTESNFSQIPPNRIYEEAFKLSRLVTYFEVKRDRSVIKYILGNLRYFIMIGFRVYPSYQTHQVSQTGDIPMPSEAELAQGTDSGHACNIVGVDDDRQVYIIVNNYGTSWGDGGYGTIPYAYFEDENLVTEAKILVPSDDFASKYTAAMSEPDETIPTKETDTTTENQQSLSDLTKFILWILTLLIIMVVGIFLFKMLWPSNASHSGPLTKPDNLMTIPKVN